MKKDFKASEDPEIKELFEDAKRAKAKAVETGDPEEYRKARNITAVATRKEFAEERDDPTTTPSGKTENDPN